MTISGRVRSAASMPPGALGRKIFERTRVNIRNVALSLRDKTASTRTPRADAPIGPLGTIFVMPPLDSLTTRAGLISQLGDLWLSHRFDLLGSGWVEVRHNGTCDGFEGHRYDAGRVPVPDSSGDWIASMVTRPNAKGSRDIWQLIEGIYTPIDWQIDFKSGFRWSEKTRSGRLRYGHREGVDVKVPWELARMQHLPTLAFAYTLSESGSDGFQPADTYALEFRNQVLDFAASNPPRFGVNWACTMDVAIRAANLVVAWCLFESSGFHFDTAFEEVYRASLIDHARHIAENLEWSSDLRSNHYLANIAGLVIVAAHLPIGCEADAWLAFATHELVEEVAGQFYEEGSNFEASTSYHRLSAEMALWATGVILGLASDRMTPFETGDAILAGIRSRLRRPALRVFPLPAGVTLGSGRKTSPFSEGHFRRLERAARFSHDVSGSNGRVVQVGDTDSGRFLKLSPRFELMAVNDAISAFANLGNWQPPEGLTRYPVEDHLAHGEFICSAGRMFGNRVLEEWCDYAGPAVEIFDLVTGRARLASGDSSSSTTPRHVSTGDPASVEVVIPDDAERFVWLTERPGLLDGLELCGYPDFGIFVFRSPRVFVSIRCGNVGQHGNGGHAHNDQLAATISLDGIEVVRDPGTYVYTPLPRERDRYRRASAHFAPTLEGREPGRLDVGIFRLDDRAHAECVYLDENTFIGRHRGYGLFAWRKVVVLDDRIAVTDWYEGIEHLAAHHGPPFSAGYGIAACRADRPITTGQHRVVG